MIKQVKTRFAPSPTGMLHVGNARTALINFLYARKNNGQFFLRFDDTDLVRSKEEYKEAIVKDLKWLGLDCDQLITQSARLDKYQLIKNQLIEQGRLYPCFESTEELEVKRKLQLNNGLPPIYDRASLNLSKQQIEDYIQNGRKPHYRFLITADLVQWNDLVKGEVKYAGAHLGDPIVVREDGSMTYMLCSVIDDIDYNITDIIRGEDHVTNTAIQIEMFTALATTAPHFGHLSLIKASDEKISKRVGGFEIAALRDQAGFEAMTVNSFFSTIGSSKTVSVCKTLSDLIKEFDLNSFSKSPTTYLPLELERLNHKLLIELSFIEVQNRLQQFGLQIDEQFWLTVRPNLQKLHEVKEWWKILYKPELVAGLDKEFISLAQTLFPNEAVNVDTWSKWVNKINEASGKSGKELFMPLRLAITGMERGPELKNILPLIGREEIIKRLTRYTR